MAAFDEHMTNQSVVSARDDVVSDVFHAFHPKCATPANSPVLWPFQWPTNQFEPASAAPTILFFATPLYLALIQMVNDAGMVPAGKVTPSNVPP